ncbi:NsdA, partial [Streptomyces sp. NRRL F-6602]
ENAHSYRDLAYAAGGSTLYANLSAQGMRQAVDLFREDSLYQRSYALNLIGMASVHLLRDELADSAVCAEEAAHLAAKVRSERVNTRLRKTVDRALRQYPGRSETDALAELLAS